MDRTDFGDIDGDALARLARLGEGLTDEQVDELIALSAAEQQGRISRREFAKGAAALGVGGVLGGGAVGTAAADASTTDDDGNVGRPDDRVDVFSDGVDANSVSTDSATINGQQADVHKSHITTLSPSSATSSITHSFSDPIEVRGDPPEWLYVEYSMESTDSGTMWLRLNGDGSSTGDYRWFGKDGTDNSSVNEFVLADVGESFANPAGDITIRFRARSITHNIGFRSGKTVNDFSISGGYNGGSPITDIEFGYSGSGDFGDGTEIELFRRRALR